MTETGIDTEYSPRYYAELEAVRISAASVYIRALNALQLYADRSAASMKAYDFCRAFPYIINPTPYEEQQFLNCSRELLRMLYVTPTDMKLANLLAACSRCETVYMEACAAVDAVREKCSSRESPRVFETN